MQPKYVEDHKQNHLFTVLLWIIPIIFLCTSTYLTFRSFNAVHDEIREQQLSIVSQIRNNIDYRMLHHEEIANGIMMSIMTPLSTVSDTARQYAEYSDITSVLVSYADRGMIAGIRLFVPDEKIYSKQRDTIHPLSELQESRYAGQTAPGIHWLPTHKVRISFNLTTDVIALMYNLSQLNNNSELVGSLLLYIPVEKINEMLNTGNNTEDLFLIDREGTVLASNRTERIGEQILPENETRAFIDQEQGCNSYNGHMITYTGLSRPDWKLVSMIPQSTLPSLDYSRQILLIALWLITILSVICIFFSWTYQRMRSIRRQYGEQIELANYQMQSLQEQIKPHFLYNTLDIIKWMIIENHHDDAVWMVNALSKYLRMSINKTSGVTTLEQELELGRVYLEMIRKRFQNRFSFVFDVEDDVRSCCLPRLLLQPIMENAVIHGLLYCEKSNAMLTVRAWREENELSIEIEDNGKGIPAEKLDQVRKMSDTGSYGLRNISKRILLFGGEKASLQINSIEGIGTCVTVCLPVILEDPTLTAVPGSRPDSAEASVRR